MCICWEPLNISIEQMNYSGKSQSERKTVKIIANDYDERTSWISDSLYKVAKRETLAVYKLEWNVNHTMETLIKWASNVFILQWKAIQKTLQLVWYVNAHVKWHLRRKLKYLTAWNWNGIYANWENGTEQECKLNTIVQMEWRRWPTTCQKSQNEQQRKIGPSGPE